MQHPEAVSNLKRRMAQELERDRPPAYFTGFPALPAARYTSQTFFEIEQQHLWSKVWLYAAHISQLPEIGSFLKLDIPWADIFLVRGQDGDVRAFYNVCSHRGAPVVTEACGTRLGFRCIYHNWTYDTQGRLIAVAHERDFAASFDKSQLGLVEVRCETWEGLIFVNQSDASPSLREWLGMIDDEFQQFEMTRLRPAAIRSYELVCNWKLTMDAFLEVYHIKGIHPKTVGPALNEAGAVMGLLPNGHTRMTCPTNSVDRGYGTGEGQMAPIPLGEIARDYHVSHNIFPNVITPVSATSRQFLMFWPLARDRTRVDVVHFGLDWGEGAPPAQWESHLAFWEVVMDEDLQFLESQQRAIVSPGYRGYNLSWMERRLYYAHESIDRTIGIEHIPEDLRVPRLLAAHEEQPWHHAADPADPADPAG